MSKVQPLSKAVLTESEVRADRKAAKKYDQCGLGEKAVYMGSTFHPRKYYIPYEAVTHVYKRVAVSPGSGHAFLTPVLYIVVRYDDGKEQQCSFRYLNDADKMLDQLEKEHPSICLMSPEGEKKKKEKAEMEERLKNTELSLTAAKECKRLENAEWYISKRPALFNDLAAYARFKRKADLIAPSYQVIAGIVLAAGIAVIIAGGLMQKKGGFGLIPILMILAGFAAVFLMINSKVLPTPSRNKKKLGNEYNKALSDMERYISSEREFPVPACYAHPIVLKRMQRIIREQRAQTASEALEVLKSDLKAADSSVALSGDEYKEVVTVKPLFLVNSYR